MNPGDRAVRSAEWWARAPVREDGEARLRRLRSYLQRAIDTAEPIPWSRFTGLEVDAAVRALGRRPDLRGRAEREMRRRRATMAARGQDAQAQE